MPSTARSRASGRGPDGNPRAQVTAPMSERQQLALVMQISSQDAPPVAPPPTVEEKKKSRQQRNRRGETPLHLAAMKGDHDQVKKLLDQGQDPDVADFAGWTPLHEACSYGWHRIVVVLVKGGANVNAKGLDDDTPLHDATTSGILEMVKFLLEHGANPFAKNAKGKTPIDYAAPNVLKYLQSLKDSNASTSDNSKRTNMDGLVQRKACSQEIFISESSDDSNASTSDNSKRTNMDGLVQRKACSPDMFTPESNDDSNTGTAHHNRVRDDSTKKGSNASTSDNSKRTNMDGLVQRKACSLEIFISESSDDSNTRTAHHNRVRDNSTKKGSNASTSDNSKRTNMDGLVQRKACSPEIFISETSDETSQLSSGIVSSSQDDASAKRFSEDGQENDGNEDDGNKRKKRKDVDEKEPMGKPAPVSRGGPGRVLTGNKPPGPASKTGAPQLNKSAQNTKGGTGGTSSGKGNAQSQGKGSGAGAKASAQGAHQGKSSGSTKGASSSQANKQDRKSPVASPKPGQSKDADGDMEEQKSQESAAPKVPPLKIVIPGGASGSGNRNEQDSEGSSGQRGSGKGRGNASTLPYIIPCTISETQSSSFDSIHSSDFDVKRTGDSSKAGQRVLRSHRTYDGNKEKGGTTSCKRNENRSGKGKSLSSNKSLTTSGSSQDCEPSTSSASSSGRSETVAVPGPSVELHPRKRKIKASKDQVKSDQSSQSRSTKSEQSSESSASSQSVSNSNPYQMYIHIRKQIDRRQRGLFPVKPKPPKDFNKYLMNRCTYTLQSNVNPEPQIEVPPTLPTQMVEEFTSQEKERAKLRIQHLVEKEKLVLAVEQEILRVHGRAERAVANQALPFSVCTILRDREVYNVLAPEQEEKRNAQRSRCNGRQINSWLQEVDDKWERIKEGMLRRQHTEAETLHKVQIMEWEWKLKEIGLCDYKTTPQIDPTHVPQLHVSNFDLPA